MIQTQTLPNTYSPNMQSKQFNTSALTVWADQQNFHIEPNYSKSLIPTVLQINRKTNKILEINLAQFQNNKPKSATPFHFSFFIGVLDLGGKKVLLFSETVQIVCAISKRQIFRITKPLFLFYQPEDKKALSDEEAKILVNLVVIFEQGMYFSYAYNLTQPLHHIKKIDKSMWSFNAFNWAQPFQNELIKYGCNGMWCIPVIQGFVNKIQLYINAQKMRIILISRRSIKNGGPWQYTSGLSQKGGNVANYVQTEQILCVNQYFFSFLQARGSVPLYWSQKFSYGVPSGVLLQKSIQQNYSGYKLHIANILHNRQYRNIILFNLLSKQSASQRKLIQNYQYLVKITQKQKTLYLSPSSSSSSTSSSSSSPSTKAQVGIHYYHFDLHSKCPNKSYKVLNSFLTSQLKSAILTCQFTALRQKPDLSYQILAIQDSLIRTNCGTCIDRTNIAQSRIAAYQLVQILRCVKMEIPILRDDLAFVDNDEGEGSNFAGMYRNLWADNGDNISKQYTGTGSIQSIAVRKGKLSYMTTIDHGMKSLVRALRNIRQEDQQKNKTIIFMMKGVKDRNYKYELPKIQPKTLTQKQQQKPQQNQKPTKTQKQSQNSTMDKTNSNANTTGNSIPKQQGEQPDNSSPITESSQNINTNTNTNTDTDTDIKTN